jgi:hypothetical protein
MFGPARPGLEVYLVLTSFEQESKVLVGQASDGSERKTVVVPRLGGVGVAPCFPESQLLFG